MPLTPIPLDSIIGDWGGEWYFTKPADLGWHEWDNKFYAMLLRMHDEEHGIWAYCSDESDKGSGCAQVRATRKGVGEVLISVEKWYYQKSSASKPILPRDFSFTLSLYDMEALEAHEADFGGPLFRDPEKVLFSTTQHDSFEEVMWFGKIVDDMSVYPTWHPDYANLNGVLEGVFRFGETGADNNNSSYVFVFPMDNGAIRLRYLYTELDETVMSDHRDYGIVEYSTAHDFESGGFANIVPWRFILYPTKNQKLLNGSSDFTLYYKNVYIPYLIRYAQSCEWEDGFESVDSSAWDGKLDFSQTIVVMCKKLIFAAQEVIAGRFDGDGYNVSAIAEAGYKPKKVELTRYDPETDPDTLIIRNDLMMDGTEDIIIGRFCCEVNVMGKPYDCCQLIINDEYFFREVGTETQMEIRIVDVDTSDAFKEIALSFVHKDGNAYIILYRYDDGTLRRLNYVWGKMDASFAGNGNLVSFPGDGTAVSRVPQETGYLNETIAIVEDGRSWSGNTHYYLPSPY